MYDVVRITMGQDTKRTQHEMNLSAHMMFPSSYMVSMSRNCYCGGLFPVIFYIVLRGDRSTKLHFLLSVKEFGPFQTIQTVPLCKK